MAAVAPSIPSQLTSSGTKKKNNKKKKSAKGKSNGDPARSLENDKDLLEDNEEEEEDVDDVGRSGTNALEETHSIETGSLQTNGHNYGVMSNGHAGKPSRPLSSTRAAESASASDTSVRLEAMSQEREALRAEVEQLRKSLEDIQGKNKEELEAVKERYGDDVSNIQAKHSQEVSEIREAHTQEVSNIQSKHADVVSKIKEEHTEEMSTIRAELEETEAAKDQAETQYQALLGRINTIKSSLGERLKADKQELAEAKEQIEELEAQNEELQKRVESLVADGKVLEGEYKESSKELSSLRNRHNLSQQNWVSEREDLIQQSKHLREEADAAKEAMGDWEVLAMEERSHRENLTERARDLDEQFSSQKEAYEAAVSQRDSHSQAVEGLQRALQEVQDARKRELREMVESYEEQLQSLKKLVQQSDTRSTEAETAKNSLQAELERLIPFEKEVKEKNLLIGKLRHEAIVLNDHLTKALRFLKKAKPEDNIDRKIVTNHFIHFLALDRSDPKKFQILQLIASLLNWTDEQKEQAGLARPGALSNSLRLPASPFHRTPSTPSLSSEFFNESPASRESLAELWTGFLERSAEEGSNAGSRSGSVSGAPHRPDTGSGDRRG